MPTLFEIKENNVIPKYLQLQENIVHLIKEGKLHKGDKLPSINEISSEQNLARETVIKALSNLKLKGVIESVHGKGFFISSTDINQNYRIFILFDTLTAYKEELYHSIRTELYNSAGVDIYFHHFNIEVFESLIDNHLHSYTSYIILPFEHSEINRILKKIPYDRLFLIDRFPKSYECKYKGVYQDFENDIFNSLQGTKEKVLRYVKFKFIFRNTSTEPPIELIAGFKRFCITNKVDYEILFELPHRALEKGSAYLVIDDEDLVSLVLYTIKENLLIGKEIGIISYNDTPLKKVVANGISVISTDFEQMGKHIVNFIKKNTDECIKNPCQFIDRGSL